MKNNLIWAYTKIIVTITVFTILILISIFGGEIHINIHFHTLAELIETIKKYE